ncbi:hypothetical protein [Pelagovum pacificum]|uniref:Sulfotransferase n=1 Tax=Pelagovum pacificum TaxID=2588711 RepID=A0A5C5GAP4_9RHOB|nr:hypothetical protein [Pelagovum pacificum]QQA41319.1 hypothetical protein I8N54_10800 [Pelagovum pacificum]TNY31875.1 hypothetical protein FHY64_00795 [Pelagovum pacificum]
MDVILHIGAHRTGTTTLQRFLDRNRAMLREAGVIAWTPRHLRGGMLDGLMRRPEDTGPADLLRIERAIGRLRIAHQVALRDGTRQLILSDENLIGAARDNLRAGRLYPGLVERLSRLRPAFDQVSRIGLAVRGYEGYWSSACAFAVARGHRMPDAAALDRLVTQPRRWRHVVTEVAKIFPEAELRVWSFEHGAGRPEWQAGLLTGSPSSGGPTTGAPCFTPGLPGARDRCAASPRVATLRAVLTDAGLPVTALPDGDARWVPFDAEQRRALDALYRDDIAWLRAGADGLAIFEGGPTAPVTGEADGIRGVPPPPMTGGQDLGRRHLTG